MILFDLTTSSAFLTGEARMGTKSCGVDVLRTCALAAFGLTLFGVASHARAAASVGEFFPYFSNANSPLVIGSPGYKLEDFEPSTPTLPILGVNLTTLHGSSVDPGLSVDGDDGSIDG